MSFPPRYHMAPKSRRITGEASRAKAVREALALFATSGFKGTTIARLAAGTGLSQSGLLHHFPSKAKLLSAVLEARDAEDGEFLNTEHGEAPMGWEAFDALQALVARNSSRPQFVGLYVKMAAEAVEEDHPAHEWLENRYAAMKEWLTDAVRFGQVRGEIVSDAPVDHLVRTTIAVLDGLQQQWLIDPSKFSMVEAFGFHIAGLRACWQVTEMESASAALSAVT
ncbi:TetR/AcrR family transcriptional regulator [Arthrobacter sp. FW306-2-2C-D06B]|uniref:TetR/AcrR family transcriptional regulator n=1 Tax=Arthrobacter sp. FW306-2-2C-D06B TaxID=2879618 RepID=UPI001F372133|nr:TetR/AcrR family transcriptional regulator [Arthrobacter sp. FW306-2-2C-D06B]UKA60533.1 TetR/AcrR family transcriptional regulator [Arthrobacter sp. FW306-2-2C-D06B]